MSKKKLDGKTVKSPFEYDLYHEIKEMLPEGSKIEYEADKLSYTITYQYIPDFTVTLPNGKKIYIEAKGNGRQFDGHTRRKMKTIKDIYSHLPIYIVFYANGKISGTKKRKRGGYYLQSEWSDRTGYEYSIKHPNPKWFE